MPTIRDICEDALRLIGVVSLDEPMQAETATDALRRFNAMIFVWKTEGVDIGPYEMGLSDPWPFGMEWVEAATVLLAARLGSVYQVPSPNPSEHWLALQRAHIEVPRTRSPSALLRTSASRGL